MSGVIEIEMGTTIKTILAEIADGSKKVKHSKLFNWEVLQVHLLRQKTLNYLLIMML